MPSNYNYVNARDNENRTPLHYALDLSPDDNKEEIVKILQQAGAE